MHKGRTKETAMPNPPSVIPVSDEQAKAISEALKVLQGLGGFLKETFGTVPQDLVGLLGGDWLRVRRAENAAKIFEMVQQRLRARGVHAAEPASLSLVLPMVAAAADESRDELQDLWARLLAAAADPNRSKFFRLAFIDAAKRMDPLDAAVLRQAHLINQIITGGGRDRLTKDLHVSRDEVEVSLANLSKLGLMDTLPPQAQPAQGNLAMSSFGREFLRAVSD